MIQIYVDHISPRIEYAFDFIFGSRGFEYALSSKESANAHLRYSQTLDKGSDAILSAAFMTKDTVVDLSIQYEHFGDTECYCFDGVTDPVASIFYMLTRYEEYTCEHIDEYGRFPLSSSTIPIDWLTKSMCDRWAEEVISLIDPALIEKEHPVTIVPTFDIDNTYAYKLKTGKRKWLSILKDFVKTDFRRLRERNAVLRGALKDPYDTFDKIRSIHSRFPETKVFWLIGKWGKKDRNISIDNKGHRELIKSLRKGGLTIGLHPSFGSFKNQQIIAAEKKKLEAICSQSIRLSRQHFLRFQIVDTFQHLLDCGFNEEYSMGFAEHIGFRSGTARPHQWFDLTRNQVTELVIHPFVYMDGTLREYMSLSPEQSRVQIQRLYEEVSRYGGDFVFIWHNETIGDYGNWKGWSEVLEFTLSLSHESI